MDIEKQAFKKADQAIRQLLTLLKISSRYFDPCYSGMDLILPYGYICIRPGVKHVYAYRTASLDPEDKVPALSPSEHARLLAFLEACARNLAIMYRRDAFGFVWCVTDEKAYQVCCQKFEYTSADFKACHQPETKKGRFSGSGLW